MKGYSQIALLFFALSTCAYIAMFLCPQETDAITPDGMNMIYSVLDSARYFFLAMGALMIVLGIDRADMAVYVLKYGLIYLCGFQLSRMCFHLFTAERLSIVEFGTYGVGLVAVLLLAKYRIDNANR